METIDISNNLSDEGHSAREVNASIHSIEQNSVVDEPSAPLASIDQKDELAPVVSAEPIGMVFWKILSIISCHLKKKTISLIS